MFVSGGWEGSVNFWITTEDTPVASMETAHESSVFALDWHPLGHILASGSNDHSTKFWTRNRPGDAMNDRYNMSKEEAEALGLKAEESMDHEEAFMGEALPGLGQNTLVGELPGLRNSRYSARTDNQNNDQRRNGNQQRNDRSRNDRPQSQNQNSNNRNDRGYGNNDRGYGNNDRGYGNKDRGYGNSMRQDNRQDRNNGRENNRNNDRQGYSQRGNRDH
jgi:hypothetical protein